MISAEILISSLAFISLVLFGLGMYTYVGLVRDRRELIERIRQVDVGAPPQGEKGVFHGIKDYWVRFVVALGNRVKPKKEGQISNLRKMFMRAGLRGENAPVIFYGIKAFLAMLFFVLFLIVKLWFFITMTSLHLMQLSIALALIGFYLPNLWMRVRTARRKQKIQEGLPDALDLMVVCVESGSGLDAAITRVGEEMRLSNRVLSEEFRLFSLEMRAGKQRQDAMRNLAERTDLEDVSSLVTLLIQTDRFGTSIAQALRVHSDSMRTKRYQKAEEMANKMPVKLIFPLFLFIFPAILVAVLGPAVITIFRTLIRGGH